MHILKQLVKDQKNGIKRGIVSICSSNKYVIRVAMKNAKKYDEHVLIESTANQVNQFGGYTGMNPEDFVDYINNIAEEIGYPKERIILGGDHLGPLTWAGENETSAMEKAKQLVYDYVMAGFTKIHIDTSMRLADDDKDAMLDIRIIAKRSAVLASICEDAYVQLKKVNPHAVHPVYVIGSEVPIPGGAQENEETVAVTTAKDLHETINVFRDNYIKYGQETAFDHVIAIVVQPGVEFADNTIVEYDRDKAIELIRALEKYPQFVLEGHSTDYQNQEKLTEMIQDGIAILKVGPALTFALREALFALAIIEEELLRGTGVHLSDFREILERVMLKEPSHWQKHYYGSQDKLIQKRRYSFSDRCRYYLPNEAVDHSIKRLINNLDKVEIPLNLLSQYMPIQYTKVREKKIKNNVVELLEDRITDYFDDYKGTRPFLEQNS